MEGPGLQPPGSRPARERAADHAAFRGRLPRTVEELVKLPGVGHATAAAVIVYAFNEPLVFIETNIRRVFLHFFFPDQENVPDVSILPLVEKTLDRENPRNGTTRSWTTAPRFLEARQESQSPKQPVQGAVPVRRIPAATARQHSLR